MAEDNWEIRMCDVYRLTLNDVSTKEVKYCSLCHAWICRACEFSSRRLVAFAKSRGLALEQFRRLQHPGE